MSAEISYVPPGSPPTGITEISSSVVAPFATVPFKTFPLKWFALRIIIVCVCAFFSFFTENLILLPF